MGEVISLFKEKHKTDIGNSEQNVYFCKGCGKFYDTVKQRCVCDGDLIQPVIKSVFVYGGNGLNYIVSEKVKEVFDFKILLEEISESIVPCDVLNLYILDEVSLQVVVTIINVCILNEIKLILYYYESDCDTYFKQELFY
ncbi:hypothetical protein [Thomasclavelia spiroformis]|uniref:hypothetical protein n=1 Tax=Thomasclavelia spiroformis TaxID=29348 RepID=UPI0024B24E4E|nr:hypothetical protein [Thomasclavelia spiroformis]